MSINAKTLAVRCCRRQRSLTLTVVGALLISLSGGQSAQAQCSGGEGGGAGGRVAPAGGATGGVTSGGSLANGAGNLLQLQQMAALVQQQEMVQQQQRMALMQRQQAMAAWQQQQAQMTESRDSVSTRAPAPYTYVERAQRRRAATLRLSRMRLNDNQQLAGLSRDR